MIHSKRRRVIKPDAPLSEVRKALSHDGKVGYRTASEAKEAAKYLRKKLGPRTKPYKCKYCPDFHIGHWRKKRSNLQERIDEVQTKAR